MKTYQLNGKSYTEDEVIAVHDMWQAVLERDSIKYDIELALDVIRDSDISEYVRNNEAEIIEQCLENLLDWGEWQDECLSRSCLLRYNLIADKITEMYERRMRND